MTTTRIIVGDVLERLADLEEESVHCVVTSPPYWGLRDYGAPGQIGLEATPEEHVERIVDVFAEVRRVLRRDGTLWLNYGDCYWSQGIRRHGGWNGSTPSPQRTAGIYAGRCERRDDLKPKDLVGMPWRVAFGLQAAGWWIRSEIVWSKPDAMPESARDRPTSAHERIFLLAKSPRYFFDREAVLESPDRDDQPADPRHSGGRNMRNVWTITKTGYTGAHFATFPPEIPARCIKAGTSLKGCCSACGAPWCRVMTEATGGAIGASWHPHEDDEVTGNRKVVTSSGYLRGVTVGWRPSCSCDSGEPVPCTVLDPFLGSGTTALVAAHLGRDAIGIELSSEYARIAETRIREDGSPLFSTLEVVRPE